MNRYLKAVVKKVKEKITVIASTSVIDRQGESIDQAGWDLRNFLKNPVMLWAHNYDELPLGKWDNVRVEDGVLKMDAVFASKEANPKAENVRLLIEEGIEQTVSVGFIPLEREGHIITKSELLEVSFVPVPANPEALALAVAKGYNPEIMKCDEEFCVDCGAKLAEGNRNERKTDKENVVELVCNECIKEKANTKPSVCEPDSDDFDPELCGAVFCDPNSPNYNPDFCDMMKGVCGFYKKKIEGEEKSGRVLSEKNRNLIKDAISQFKNSISIMEQLLDATNPPEKGADDLSLGGDGVEKDHGSQSKNGAVEFSQELIEGLLSHSRVADKANEQLIRVLKSVLITNK